MQAKRGVNGQGRCPIIPLLHNNPLLLLFLVAAVGYPLGELDRSQLDYRRIVVSNVKIVGHRLRDLNLPQHFGAIVTRIRRGDVEWLLTGRTVLELGDRVRVLTRRDNMQAVTAFFGDSYHVRSVKWTC